MLEVRRISSKELVRIYSDYIRDCIDGKSTSNPFIEDLVLVKGDNAVDIYGNIIGKVVE